MNVRLLGDIESPWNHRARRFIEPPVYWLGNESLRAPHSNFWRLEMLQDGVRYAVESEKPILDAAAIWPKIRVGSWVQCNIYHIDREHNWCLSAGPMGERIRGTNVGLIAKAPDWQDHEEAPLDYGASIRANFGWFDSVEQNSMAYYREPGMPAWWWHAAESSHPWKTKFQEGSYPALSSQGIGAYLYAARVVPERAKQCRETARAIGDWLLKNHTPMTGAAPGMPYTAMTEGKFDYSCDGSAINVSRGALPGIGMIMLYQETHDNKYLDYAKHIAGVLVKFIREDGGFPYRINPETGEVVEEYTNGHVLVGIFLHTLHQVSPDDRWRNGARRIVRWICQHPLRDFNWKACYEDVNEKAEFANLSSFDAVWSVRLLCRHAKEDPEHIERVRKLLRWVEDQFVNFGDESSLGVRTYYPVVREQWICDYPMEGHTANYASSCWEFFQHTGEAIYRRKAVAALNAIVRSQRDDGAYSTFGTDRETRETSLPSWFNANHFAMRELSYFLLRQKSETPLPM